MRLIIKKTLERDKMNKDKVIEKLKSKRMKNNASSPQISSYIIGWNEGLEYAIEQLKKD